MIKISNNQKNKLFKLTLKFSGYFTVFLIALFLITLIYNSFLSLSTLSLPFLFSSKWEPNAGNFGAAPFIIGTLLTSLLALLISIPFSYIAPQSFVETNIKGTLNICQAAKENQISRLIHTSTSEVYGTACCIK